MLYNLLKVTQAHKRAAKVQTQNGPGFEVLGLNHCCVRLALSAFPFRPVSVRGSVTSTHILWDGWPLGPWSLAFQEVHKCMLTLVYSCPEVTCLKTPRSLHKTIQEDFTIAHPIKFISLWENVSEAGENTRLCIQVGGHNRRGCPVILDALACGRPHSLTLSRAWGSLPALDQNHYASQWPEPHKPRTSLN